MVILLKAGPPFYIAESSDNRGLSESPVRKNPTATTRPESGKPIARTRVYRIRVADVEVEVHRKRIRHLYLRVGPPDGRLRVSAPLRLDEDSIRRAVTKRMSWIRRQQERQRRRERESDRSLQSGERHYVEGTGCRLHVTTHDGPPYVRLLDESTLEMGVRPGTGRDERADLLAAWYRERLKSSIPRLIAAWEPFMGVTVKEWRIRKMKTRWGSCNVRYGRIWLSLELAKKPMECLEYVIVHEMAHLIEPSHNRRFWGILDRHLPDWRTRRDELNRLPAMEGTE